MKKYALIAAIVFIASSTGITFAYFGNMGKMENVDKPEFETYGKTIEYKKVSMLEHLDQLVDNGKITQEQADEKITWIEERMAEKQENCNGDKTPLFKRDGTGEKGMRIRFLK